MCSAGVKGKPYMEIAFLDSQLVTLRSRGCFFLRDPTSGVVLKDLDAKRQPGLGFRLKVGTLRRRNAKNNSHAQLAPGDPHPMHLRLQAEQGSASVAQRAFFSRWIESRVAGFFLPTKFGSKAQKMVGFFVGVFNLFNTKIHIRQEKLPFCFPF